ncbi:MAG: hypothetical protein BA863_09975 [Desulfovibrio sp. S3730MH75]|nr:MAG: hypothetical protein BA863_09975 [Desulfovibrio sp. S3730MH75]
MYARIVLRDFRNGLADELKHFDSNQARAALGAALAALAAVLLSDWLNLPKPYWAGVSALVVSRSSYASSLIKGVLRVIGTISGCILALVLVGTFIDNSFAMLCLIFFVSVGTVLVSSYRDKDSYAWTMCGFMIVLVSIAGLTNPNNVYNFAFYRTFEISLGTIMAVIMSAIVNPVIPSQVAVQKMVGVWTDLADALRCGGSGWENGQHDIERIRDLKQRTKSTLDQLPKLVFESRVEGGLTPEQVALFSRLHSIAARFSKRLFILLEWRTALLQGYPALFTTEITEISTQLDTIAQAVEQNLVSSDEVAIANAAQSLSSAVDTLISRHLNYIHAEEHDGRTVEEILAWGEFQRMITKLSNSFQELVSSELVESGSKNKPAVRERMLVKQALSLGLATVLVPLIWKWLDLPGMLQIGVTSLILLNPDPVETWRKGVLRFTGCVTGGSLGLLLLGVFVGHYLGTWATAYFILIFIFSYIDHGDPRCSYTGLQGGIALTMTLVQGLGPGTSLEPPLTRLCGILAGFALWNIIHSLFGGYNPMREFPIQLKNMFTNLAEALSGATEGEKERYIAEVESTLKIAHKAQDVLIWQGSLNPSDIAISQDVLVNADKINDELRQALQIPENPEARSMLAESALRLPCLLHEAGNYLLVPFTWHALHKLLDNVEQDFENDFKKINKFASDHNIGHEARLEAAVVLMSMKSLLQSLAVVAEKVRADGVFEGLMTDS